MSWLSTNLAASISCYPKGLSRSVIGLLYLNVTKCICECVWQKILEVHEHKNHMLQHSESTNSLNYACTQNVLWGISFFIFLMAPHFTFTTLRTTIYILHAFWQPQSLPPCKLIKVFWQWCGRLGHITEQQYFADFSLFLMLAEVIYRQ
jgi:hypothetical protein